MEHAVPFVIVAVGIAVVLSMIIVLRINAFIALICAALVVSFLAPGPWDTKVSRVAFAFGENAGKIGLVIGFAAVIGEAMMRSGAADRIVVAFLRLMGEKRAPMALMGSGFVLSVPVFFDTVFYLLVPLARSLFRTTRRNYLLSIMAISAGGAITHTLVPPTPGPLAMAENLNFPVGVMILVGGLVALPAAVSGLIFGRILQNRVTIADPVFPEDEIAAAGEAVSGDAPGSGEAAATDAGRETNSTEDSSDLPEPVARTLADARTVPLWEALLPVILPVLLISGDTIVGVLAGSADSGIWVQLQTVTSILGNPSLALLLSMAVALITWVRTKRPAGGEFSQAVETALLSAGLIILITSAGGAFGAMLKETGLSDVIQSAFAAPETTGTASSIDGVAEAAADASAPPAASSLGGVIAVLVGFGLAALLKVAQGSSTTAMITVSSMMGAMGLGIAELGFHPVYLATAIGAGSLIGSWMNDSGFWIVARMSGMTEAQALKSWTPLLLVLGTVSLMMTLILTQILPLTGVPS